MKRINERENNMQWTNILVPLLGGEHDARLLNGAKAVAEPFNATITAAFASPSPVTIFGWVGEGGMGPTDVAISTLQTSIDKGQARCRQLLAALDYPKTNFEAVSADAWIGLRSVSRLADVVIWDRSVTRGHGFLASAFQQILLDERRPAMIMDREISYGGTVAVAWDGGREASRALRRSIPLLRRADRVVIVSVPHAMSRPCDGQRAIEYLADNGVQADQEVLHTRGDAGPIIMDAVRRLGAGVLVAGAFGHPRLQRFIFGGTTQFLVDGTGHAALFLSH